MLFEGVFLRDPVAKIRVCMHEWVLLGAPNQCPGPTPSDLVLHEEP